MFKLDQRAPLGACEREAMPSERKGAPILADEVVFHFDRAFTLAEVSERLGISLRQVQAHIDDGNLVAVDVGRGDIRRDLRVLDEDLEGFARRRKTGVVKDKREVRTTRHVPEARPAGESFADRRAKLLEARRT